MPNSKKLEAVKQIAAMFEKKPNMVFTDYRGLTSDEMTQLRKELRQVGISYTVAKNRLLKLAARQAGLEDSLDVNLSGPTAVAVLDEEAATIAKILVKAAKHYKNLELTGAFLEGKLSGLDELTFMAELPDMDTLRGMLASTLAAPITGLAAALSGTIRKLAAVLDEVRKSREQAA